MAQEPHVLRPLSLADLFDEAFSLYRNNFLMMVGIAGLAYIPFEILLRVLAGGVSQGTSSEEALRAVGALLWAALLFLLFYLFAEAALTKAIAERYLGHPTNIADAYGFVLKRFFPFLGTLILVALAYLVGFIAFFIGALIVSFWLALVIPVFVVEDRAYGNAMQRSRELAKGNWGRIFLLWLLTGLLNWVVGLAGGGLSLWIFGMNPIGVEAVLAGTLEGIFDAVALAIGLAAFVVLYFDIRVRKEGYDLEVLAQEMATRAGTALGTTPPSVS